MLKCANLKKNIAGAESTIGGAEISIEGAEGHPKGIQIDTHAFEQIQRHDRNKLDLILLNVTR